MDKPISNWQRIKRREFLKTTGLAAVALSGGFVPQRASGQGKTGGTLVFAGTGLSPNIEPHMQGLDIWQKRKPLLYENLVWVDEALEP